MRKYIGTCIYCGSKKDLSDEHVVPYGLHPKGQVQFVLEKASCQVCKDVTSKFERGVLRNLFRMARASLEMKTYRKHPDKFLITVGGEDKEIPIKDLGAPILLPIFTEPSADKIGIDVIGSQLIWHGKEKLMKLINNKDGVGVKWNFQPTDFAKMIAKIAYGCAIYQYGMERFEKVFVLPPILGITDNIGSWVGCIKEHTVGENYINIELGINKRQVLAHVTLFERWNGPTYVVLIGRVK